MYPVYTFNKTFSFIDMNEASLDDNGNIVPLKGEQRVVPAEVDDSICEVLLDTGAGTSLVSDTFVHQMGLQIYKTPPLKVKGVVPGATTKVEEATLVTLTIGGIRYKIPMYVSPGGHRDVIIGNPVINMYPELLKVNPINIQDSRIGATITDSLSVTVPLKKTISKELLRRIGRIKSEIMNTPTVDTTGTGDEQMVWDVSNHNPLQRPIHTKGSLNPFTKNNGFRNNKVSKIRHMKQQVKTPLTLAKNEFLKSVTEINQQRTPEVTVNVLTLLEDRQLRKLTNKNPSKWDAVCVIVTEVKDNPEVNTSFENLPNDLRRDFVGTVRDDLPPISEQNQDCVHEILLKDNARVPRLPPYRRTPKEERIIQEIVDDMLVKKQIEPSKGAFSSPVVLVKKKDGSARLCVDYRVLNEATVKDPFPLPRIEVLLGKIGSAKVFSTLDLHSGYHQIPVKTEDVPKTAFVIHNGKYQYRVMPFGLVNAPSTFARYMADIFRDLDCVLVYLDDILVMSDSLEQHYKDLRVVLGRLKEHNLIAKKKKCHFLEDSVEFLGYMISAGKIEPIMAKCEAIEKIPECKTVKDAQRFLGTINYYRRFIPYCSQISRPIIDFVSKNREWDTECCDAFRELKKRLISKPILVPFDPKKEYRLTTDASKLGYGGVLEEVQGNTLVGVVGYFSKTTSGPEKDFQPGELEFLAIIYSLRHFKYLLHGKHFVLRTDHISILSVRNKRTEPGKRLSKWLDELSEYDFTLEYLPGPKNLVADTLSRNIAEVAALSTVVTINPATWTKEWLCDNYWAAVISLIAPQVKVSPLQDEDYVKNRELLQIRRKYLQKFQWKDNQLWLDDRKCVPDTRVNELLEVYHDHGLFGGHFGISTTYTKLASKYFWPKMHKTVDRYVKTCVQCQLMKVNRGKSQGLLMPLPVPEERWGWITLDFVTGFPPTKTGYDMILVVVCRMSKRAHFIACHKRLTSNGLFNLLYRFIFAYHGFPRYITSDRDIRIDNHEFKECMSRLGIQLRMSAANNPQTDGQSERTIQTLSGLIRRYASKNRDTWDMLLPQMEYLYNSTPTKSGLIPFQVDIGFVPNQPELQTENELNAKSLSAVALMRLLAGFSARAKDAIIAAQQEQEYQYNKNRTEVKFQLGEMVLLHRQAYWTGGKYMKVEPFYVGPFRVVKVLSDNAYEIDLDEMTKKHRVFNVKFLKKLRVRKMYEYRAPPLPGPEMRKRLLEIDAISGYDIEQEQYYCMFRGVDPQFRVRVPRKVFETLPKEVYQSLISNFNTLAKEATPLEDHSENAQLEQDDLGGEDVA